MLFVFIDTKFVILFGLALKKIKSFMKKEFRIIFEELMNIFKKKTCTNLKIYEYLLLYIVLSCIVFQMRTTGIF